VDFNGLALSDTEGKMIVLNPMAFVWITLYYLMHQIDAGMATHSMKSNESKNLTQHILANLNLSQKSVGTLAISSSDIVQKAVNVWNSVELQLYAFERRHREDATYESGAGTS
jgi:CRISPR/Cas system CMR subunit Cmr4 (Cas7 group RAMP superfamily)